ncbi:MotA/TolQ/ExbB proton channel family protein [Thiohalorhabdus sp. Cl-TMA]|uniref:MotA/TolQ/ExbB proton channel family protein n=1 Tax=Thiohalorhabdus methylotrophus TaxID=3242694 RepID=A0ABV4TW35_9GAMM
MIELLIRGGWMMLPLLVLSLLALAIIAERLFSLRARRILPPELVSALEADIERGDLGQARERAERDPSPLAAVLASGLRNSGLRREVIKESIEETGRHVVADLSRYLTLLGTIAAISPLLGLLGTVLGMINVFTVITSQGVGDPSVLAGGISQALLTTAFGMSIAIPALAMHRYFNAKLDRLVVDMEQHALRMAEILQGDRP